MGDRKFSSSYYYSPRASSSSAHHSPQHVAVQPGPSPLPLPPPPPSQSRLFAGERSAAVTKLECYLIPGLARPHTSTGTIPDPKDIAPWLAAAGRPNIVVSSDDDDDNNNSPPSAVLRLVFVEKEHDRVEGPHPFFKDPIRSEVHEVLGLPLSSPSRQSELKEDEDEEDKDYLTWRGVGACGRYTVSDTKTVFVLQRTSASHTFTCVLSWNRAKRVTRGYVVYGPQIAKRYLGRILEDVLELFGRLPAERTWLAAPVASVMFTARAVTERMNKLHMDLVKVETAAEHSVWARPRRRHPGMIDGESEKGEEEKEEEEEYEDDYSTLSKRLGRYNTAFCFMDAATRTTSMRVDFLLKELEREELLEEKVLNGGGGGIEGMRLRERIELLRSRLEHMVLHCAIKDRLDTQQTVLFNLISQQDSSLSTEIASDSKELAAASKRDSSSMKVIAILTTLFLPGTFVSTLFSMPIWDWEVSRLSDVSARYMWFYWVLTIPLTVLVMGLFGGYAWYQGRKNERSSRRARESILTDIRVRKAR
ncbi:hypothetical protein QBC44DRAFT_63463 [Cladorrhinum sp. PSN332]|nr:hypothetical protein QBC44DRAFT_63463 [Cladorrhinum sp. PSN332]